MLGGSSMRRGVAATAALALTLGLAAPMGAAAPAGSRRKKSGGSGWTMMRHSFDRTIDGSDAESDWLMGSASMAMKDRLMLLPDVADRYALLWSKKAVDSRDFEVAFTLSGSAREVVPGEEGLHGIVAFWISLDDFAAKWDFKEILAKVNSDPAKNLKVGLDAAGLTFLGNKQNFRGLLVALLPADQRRMTGKQSVAAYWSDGQTPLTLENLLQDPKVKLTDTDWLTLGTQLKVRVHADGGIVGSKLIVAAGRHAGSVFEWAPDGENVEGSFTLEPDNTVTWKDEEKKGSWKVLRGNKLEVSIKDVTYVLRFEGGQRAVQELPEGLPKGVAFFGGKGEDTSQWDEIFRLPPWSFPLDADQSYIGFSGYSGAATALQVDLNQLETTNFDASMVGEDDTGLIEEMGDWKKALADEARYMSQASQTEAVDRLTKLLADYVEQDAGSGHALQGQLVNMGERLDLLGSDLSGYLAATQAWDLDKETFDSKAIRHQLGGIKTLLSKGKELHDEKMLAVNRAAEDLKEVQSNGGLSEPGKQKVNAAAQKSKEVENLASAGSMQTNILLLLIVLSVAGLGILFLNRMRYYEKRHFI